MSNLKYDKEQLVSESLIEQPLSEAILSETPGEFSGSLSTSQIWDMATLSQATLGFDSVEGATTTSLSPNNNEMHELPAPLRGDDIVCASGKPEEVADKEPLW